MASSTPSTDQKDAPETEPAGRAVETPAEDLGNMLADEAEQVERELGFSGTFRPPKTLSTAQRGQELSLSCMSGPLRDQSWPISETPLIIGRDDSCHVRVDSDEVSRRHASVVLCQGNIWVKDLGSRNGTFVNKHRTKERILTAGDQLRIGPCVFVVHL